MNSMAILRENCSLSLGRAVHAHLTKKSLKQMDLIFYFSNASVTWRSDCMATLFTQYITPVIHHLIGSLHLPKQKFFLQRFLICASLQLSTPSFKTN